MEGSIVIAKTVSKNINLDTAQCVVEQTRDRATLSVKTAKKDRKRENSRVPAIEGIGTNKIVKIDNNWERRKIVATKSGKKVVSMGAVKAEYSKKGLDDKMRRARIKAKQQLEVEAKKDEKDYA